MYIHTRTKAYIYIWRRDEFLIDDKHARRTFTREKRTRADDEMSHDRYFKYDKSRLCCFEISVTAR